MFVSSTGANANASTSQRYVSEVNAYRTSQGLPPLIQDQALAASSLVWAQQMQAQVCGSKPDGSPLQYCHDPNLGGTAPSGWSIVGENVGWDPTDIGLTPAFIASPTHEANMVDPRFTHIGIGSVRIGDEIWTVQRFIAYHNTPAPTTTAAPPTTTTAAPTTTRPPATTVAPTTTTTPTTVPHTTVPPATAAPATASAPVTTRVPVTTASTQVAAPTTTTERPATTNAPVPSTTATTPLSQDAELDLAELSIEEFEEFLFGEGGRPYDSLPNPVAYPAHPGFLVGARG